MASSKYVDVSAALQVIGCVFNKPEILEQGDKYTLTDIDFVEDLHLTVFGAIYNLFENGAKEINLNVVEDYLAQHPKARAIYDKEKGAEWLSKVSESANEATFDYYYNRLKKFTLLREFDKIGMDVQWLYDPDNILDSKKRETQEFWLDNHSLMEISQRISDKIDEVKATCVDNTFGDIQSPSYKAKEHKEELKLHPALGLPLYGPIVNTLTRGARLGCFYIRSAPQGLGKSRTLVADCCYMGASEIYDYNLGWIFTGIEQSTCYITTEQTLEEIQEMMWAFISGVPQDHIQWNTYVGDEEERVDKAIEILAKSKIYIICLPDYSMRDVENLIKRCIREYDVQYVFYDYLQSSLKILSEISSQTRGVALREDQILYMLSRHLKDIATEYEVFIETATQISGNFRDEEFPDQRLLRGSKAVSDPIDLGSIMLQVTNRDLEGLQEILGSGNFDTPNVKMSVYKNRGNKYNSMYLWMKADPGSCRYDGMFCTDWNYKYIPVDDLKIQVQKPCAF